MVHQCGRAIPRIRTIIASGVAAQITWWKAAQRNLGKTARKVGLSLKEGMAKKGGKSSQKVVATQQATLGDTPKA